MKTKGYFLTVCLNPVLQKTILLPHLYEDEVNRCREYYFDAAGKGMFVSKVLVKLGEKTIHLTQAGGRFLKCFLEMARDNFIDIRWVKSGSEIRFCYTIVNQEKNTSTEVVEEAEPVGEGTENLIMGKYRNLLGDAHTVIISGSKACGYSDMLYPDMVRLAKEKKKIVILDIRKKDLIASLPYSPDIIKPNYHEFIETFFPSFPYKRDKNSIQLLNQVKKRMLAIWKEYSVNIILTNGKNPCLYTDSDRVKSISPARITPVNTIGCGDAFTAGVAKSLYKKESIEAAVKTGLDCAKRNALTVRPGVLIDYTP